jgi:hypothetical protein
MFYCISIVSTIFHSEDGGLLWAAPCCKIFSFMSSSVHCRTKANPNGDLSNPKVRQGNKIAKLTAAILRLAAIRGVRIAVENPRNSAVFQLKPMKKCLKMVKANPVLVWLGAYGCEIPKPLHIWGNATTSVSVISLALQEVDASFCKMNLLHQQLGK